MCILTLFAYIIAVQNEDNSLKKLRRHSFVIGWISGSFLAPLNFLFIFYILNDNTYLVFINVLNSYHGIGIICFLQLFNIVASILLILGVRRENRLFLLPWLIINIICPNIYFCLFYLFYYKSIIGASRLLLAIGWSIYAWYIVFALYCKYNRKYADGIRGREQVYVINITDGDTLKEETLNDHQLHV